MSFCTCVYNYLCRKAVLACVRMFVYWSTDVPSLTLGSAAAGDRKNWSFQCQALCLGRAGQIGQALRWTSQGGYGITVSMCWPPPTTRGVACPIRKTPRGRSGHTGGICLPSGGCHPPELLDLSRENAAPMPPIQISRKWDVCLSPTKPKTAVHQTRVTFGLW